MERDFVLGVKDTATNDFNSHAHVERDGEVAEYNLRQRYFNSHAHVERDYKIRFTDEIFKISTHTLTWSVT